MSRAAAPTRHPVAEPAIRPARASLAERYRSVRAFTESLCEPLATEDYVVQTMRDVSPTKWHLAHVTWFFETFVLREYAPGYRPLDEAYAYLFNSYYLQAGERHCRDQRGWISRPTVEEVYAYRRHVDEAMARLLEEAEGERAETLVPLVELGLHHEQQHQELLLTDIKHVLSVNPLRPAYRAEAGGDGGAGAAPPLEWIAFEEGLRWIGHEGDAFCYDNETPRHRHFLDAFLLASRPVTNGEYLEFMEDGGYERGDLWLSEGWAVARERGWSEPFYWERKDGEWIQFTLAGPRRLRPHEPVCHLSYFEADAFARWAGARLPTEQEWEVAARTVPIRGNFVEAERLHPAPIDDIPLVATREGPRAGGPVERVDADPGGSGAGSDAGTTPGSAPDGPGLLRMYGDVWEWTRSQYSPYPGYEPPPGALGEYNAKFMSNQFVLRGGSCATSVTHIRPTYRNFFPADATWQFMGMRLARAAR